MSQFIKSQELYDFGGQYLAGGVSSNFRYGGYGESPVPLYYAEGKGSHLFDVDGNRYIDYALANGPIILGHAPLSVLDRVRATLNMGQLFAGQTELEAQLAKKIVEIVPCAELVRFASSGTEAIHAAIRLARAHTQKSKVVKFEGHYHGWTDNVFVSVNPPLDSSGDDNSPKSVAQSPGQSIKALEDIITLPWNDLDLIAKIIRERSSEIAAVIMEPINCNTGAMAPEPGYLEEVRQLTSEHDVVLIFDEVITGFRVALKGAQGMLGVTPDLAVFAKALAAGFPLAALCGRKDIMELVYTQSVMHGGTYNANVVAVAAGLATIKELQRNNGSAYRDMNTRGERLMNELQSIFAKRNQNVHVQGFGTVFHPVFCIDSGSNVNNYRRFASVDVVLKNKFNAKLQTAGTRVTARGTWFLSTAHTDTDIDETLSHADRAIYEALNDA